MPFLLHSSIGQLSMRAGLFPAWRATWSAFHACGTFPGVACDLSLRVARVRESCQLYSGAARSRLWLVIGMDPPKNQRAMPIEGMKTINHAGRSPARVEVLEIVFAFLQDSQGLSLFTHARAMSRALSGF